MESWLSALILTGADTIRATLARRIAAELDDPATPKHAVPRLISQLRGLLGEMTARQATNGNGKLDVKALIKDVL